MSICSARARAEWDAAFGLGDFGSCCDMCRMLIQLSRPPDQPAARQVMQLTAMVARGHNMVPQRCVSAAGPLLADRQAQAALRDWPHN
jgi:hypothetical protein